MTDQAEGLSPEAIATVWNWWASAKDRISAAIANGSLGGSKLVSEISDAVRSLDPRFAWELGPGRTAQHNLTVSPEGNLVVRRLTAQWLASAPPPDQTWEYYASRQPAIGLSLEIQGNRFGPEDFRVGQTYDDSRERFDVVLYHPLFKKADQRIVQQALFLTLDQSLGEDDVERWIGALDATASMPPRAITLSQFIAAIDVARKSVTGEQFTIGQGQSRDGHPVFTTVNMALKQIDHLDHAFHLTAVIGLREPNANGLPGNAEAEQLDKSEDMLAAALGENAVDIGRVTWAGRREIHLYVRDPGSAAAAANAWAEQIRPWSAGHTLSYDPQWTASKEGIYAALAPRPGG